MPALYSVWEMCPDRSNWFTSEMLSLTGWIASRIPNWPPKKNHPLPKAPPVRNYSGFFPDSAVISERGAVKVELHIRCDANARPDGRRGRAAIPALHGVDNLSIAAVH